MAQLSRGRLFISPVAIKENNLIVACVHKFINMFFQTRLSRHFNYNFQCRSFGLKYQINKLVLIKIGNQRHVNIALSKFLQAKNHALCTYIYHSQIIHLQTVPLGCFLGSKVVR